MTSLTFKNYILYCVFLAFMLFQCTEKNIEAKVPNDVYSLLNHLNRSGDNDFVLLDFDGCTGCIDFKINAINNYLKKGYTVLTTSRSERKIKLSVKDSDNVVVLKKSNIKEFVHLFSNDIRVYEYNKGKLILEEIPITNFR